MTNQDRCSCFISFQHSVRVIEAGLLNWVSAVPSRRVMTESGSEANGIDGTS